MCAVLRNLRHLLAGKVGAGLISLVYLVIVAHRLGARDYGTLVLVNGYVVLVGSIVAFSGFHGLVRYGAQAVEAGDAAGLARLTRLMAVIELCCGGVAILVAMAAAPLIGPRLGWSDDAIRIGLPYSLAVIGTVRATPQGLLQIAGRFDLIGLHQLVSPLIRLIGTLAVVAAHGGLTAFLVVWLLSSVAEGVAMWLLALGSWRRLAAGARLFGPWRGAAAERSGLIGFVLLTNFDLTLRELAPNLVPLTVGWLLGPAAAGVLSLVQRVTQVLQQPAVLLSQASYAVLARMAAAGELRALRHTAWRGAGTALLAGSVIVAALAAGGNRVLGMVGGGSFAAPAGLLLLVGLARLGSLVAAPLSAALTAMGHPQQPLGIALATSLALYPILPLLLHGLGLPGAGWHMLAQGTATVAALAWFLSRGRGRVERLSSS